MIATQNEAQQAHPARASFVAAVHHSPWVRRFSIHQQVRASLWILPACYVIGALAVGILAPRLDQWLAVRTEVAPEPDNARAVLSAIGTGMITLTGFVFSFLLLMVQFGSTAFTPRLTRTLQRDWVIKNALGAFTATFIFSLTALLTYGHVERGVLAISTVLIVTTLLLLSIGLFIAMISRATDSLRASRVIRLLTDRGHAAIETTYPKPYREPRELPDQPGGRQLGPVTQVVRHVGGSSALLIALDRAELARLAAEAGAIIEYVPAIGDDIASGAELFRVHGGDAVPDGALRATLVLGDERTLEDDPSFAMRLLVDIACRALSPAVNDPTTAVRVLDGIAALLLHAAGKDLSTVAGAAEEDGRVVGPVPTWEDLLKLGTAEIRIYGARSVQVLRRLKALFQGLLDTTPGPRHPAVQAELARLEAMIAQTFNSDSDRLLASEADPQGIGPGRVASGG